MVDISARQLFQRIGFIGDLVGGADKSTKQALRKIETACHGQESKELCIAMVENCRR
jgi:hypothetical protein